MIWNDRIAFLHAPKTAGMSITKLLFDFLPGPVFTTGWHPETPQAKVDLVANRRHATLDQAVRILAARGRKLEDFERIFVGVRDPYRLEISRYNYLRLGRAADNGLEQAIALRGDFKTYLREAPFYGRFPPRLDRYYHLNGSVPANLVCLRFEGLADQVRDHIGPYLDKGFALGHENATKPSQIEDYYDAEGEALCHDRHRWFFNNGLYPRLDLSSAERR